MSKTMDQHRANWAWEHTPRNPDEKYVSLAEGAPALILATGLGQAVAFYLAKKKDHHLQLLKNLADWLLRGQNDLGLTPPAQPQKTGEDLLNAIIIGDRDAYHALTDAALDYLVWLKRFAKAKQGADQPATTDV